MSIERMTGKDWQKLMVEWEECASAFGEDISDYAVASMPVLEDLATGATYKKKGVFSFNEDGETKSVFQANLARLPGYTGEVLRVRHIVLSPRFDYDNNVEIDEYARTLAGTFAGAVGISIAKMPAQHIKFHLKSPAERAYGHLFTEALKDLTSEFSDVSMHGSWIYLSKT